MRGRSCGVAIAALAALAMAAPAAYAADPLNAYRVKPTAANKQKLAAAGYDMTEADRGTHLEVIARRGEIASLAKDGVPARLITREKALAAPGDYTGSDADFDVWTRYDAVDGDGKEQYLEQYDRIGQEPIAKLVPLAPKTHLDRDDLRAEDHQGREDHARQLAGRRCSSTHSSTRASGWRARRAAAR